MSISGRATRIVISGSRSIKDQNAVYQILTKVIRPKLDTVIHGDCPDGVDAFVKEFCDERDIIQDPDPVTREEWNKYGKAAGPMRNRRMLETGEKLVAIWDGKSPGTRSALRIACELKVETHLYFLEGE